MKFRSRASLAPIDWVHLVAAVLLSGLVTYLAHGGPQLVIGGVSVLSALGWILSVVVQQPAPPTLTAPAPPTLTAPALTAPPAAPVFSSTETPTDPKGKGGAS
jgi:hypothetical protein